MRYRSLTPLAVVCVLAGLQSGCSPRQQSPTTDPPEAPPRPLISVPLADQGTAAGTLFQELSPAETGVRFASPILENDPMRFLYASGMAAGGAAIGDVDRDGLPDIYLTGQPHGSRLYRNLGDMKFQDITEQAGVDGKDRWTRGISLADIDGDGDLDIYVCAYDAPNLLYINDGHGKFTEEAKQRGVDLIDSCHTPAVCDFDRDGDLDIYVMKYRYYQPTGKPKVVNGFKPPLVPGQPPQAYILPQYEKYYTITGVEMNPVTRAVTVFTDAYGRADVLLKNDGQGNFTDVTEKAGILPGGRGLSATWFDYNHDGYPDLYVGNDFEDPDRLYRNNGDGTFSDVIKSTVPHTPWFSMGADFGDINRDGLFDFFIADMSGTSHYKRKTGMGAMSAKADLLVSNDPQQYMRNVVYLNSGNDRFLESAYLSHLANSDWTWSVKLNDFDNDGWIDAYCTNGTSRNFNDSDNPAALDIRPNETEWDRHIRAKTPPLKEHNLAFRNQGDLRFKDVSKDWGLDHLGMSFASATGDLDGDGDLDLVVVNLDEEVDLYRNNSTGQHRVVVKLNGTLSNRHGIGAIVRLRTASGLQIRQIIPTRGYMASDQAIAHFGLGDDDHIESLEVQWPSGHVQSFADLAVDQRLTITEPETNPPASSRKPPPAEPTLFRRVDSLAKLGHRETPFDDFARQPLLPNKSSQLGPGMAWGDANGDGLEDLYLGGAHDQIGKLYLRTAEGSWNLVGPLAFLDDAHHEDMAAVWLDIDRDGDQDLYVVSGGVECEPDDPILQDRLYLNDGHGDFTRSEGIVPEFRDSGSVVATADYDQDGDLDLFVGGRIIPGKYPLPANSRLLQNENGKLKDVTETLAPAVAQSGLVTSAIWSDVDADGAVDLLVTHEWGPVKLFKNQLADTGKFVDQTKSAGLSDRFGWFNGIAGGDVDGDGDTDYVVTNFGLNTKYHATVEEPISLYYGDFEGDGKYRLVEAEYEDSTLFPVRGRSCSTAAIPSLGEKFTSYHDFALAPLEGIYDRNKLAQAEHFICNSLETGLLVNDGTGKFKFRPLPLIAQIAPAFGVAVVDVNGDGWNDIYLAQNFYGPQPETGRMAGGVSQLLLGSAEGEFLPLWPYQSGLIEAGDAKGLTVIDLNNDAAPDFVVSVNNGDGSIWQNQATSSSKRRHLKVKLNGPPGNRQAIGSRVTVTFDDGTRQLTEVYAGGGYLSHSTSTLFFGLGNRKPVRAIVRWPDGSETQTPIDDRTLPAIELTPAAAE